MIRKNAPIARTEVVPTGPSRIVVDLERLQVRVVARGMPLRPKLTPPSWRRGLSPKRDRFQQAMALVMADYDLSSDVIAEAIRIARAL